MDTYWTPVANRQSAILLSPTSSGDVSMPHIEPSNGPDSSGGSLCFCDRNGPAYGLIIKLSDSNERTYLLHPLGEALGLEEGGGFPPVIAGVIEVTAVAADLAPGDLRVGISHEVLA